MDTRISKKGRRQLSEETSVAFCGALATFRILMMKKMPLKRPK